MTAESQSRSWTRRGQDRVAVGSNVSKLPGYQATRLPSYKATRLSGYTRLQCRAGRLGQRNKYNIGTALARKGVSCTVSYGSRLYNKRGTGSQLCKISIVDLYKPMR